MQELIVEGRLSGRHIFIIAAIFFSVMLAVNALFLYQALTSPAHDVSAAPSEERPAQQDNTR